VEHMQSHADTAIRQFKKKSTLITSVKSGGRIEFSALGVLNVITKAQFSAGCGISIRAAEF